MNKPEVKMKLILPDEVLKQIPALGSQEEVRNPIVYVKFFDPSGSWTWYATEYNPKDGIFFGVVQGIETEWGNFSLDELQSITGRFGLGIERDILFTPRYISEIKGLKVTGLSYL